MIMNDEMCDSGFVVSIKGRMSAFGTPGMNVTCNMITIVGWDHNLCNGIFLPGIYMYMYVLSYTNTLTRVNTTIYSYYIRQVLSWTDEYLN